MSEQEQPVAESLSPQELEKQEEAKLKAKYNIGPNQGLGLKASGHSAFLQKRLSKGQKYFDSGDYQMAKQKFGNVANKAGLQLPGPIPFVGTGEAIPTPESVPVRKTSLVQPSKFSNIS
ncbi:alpha-endosulfine [Diorhabda carinulata]|uniref:alpha-endosulfine n=1 Tax=Diorhabda sublineata TaxID=1163346 RepID=UPI0024E0D433|nr:alpha-endosulfine [Diorhabda sublineata]XP_057654225.1 alpha-endosulfine [Diorhabda carinulata]